LLAQKRTTLTRSAKVPFTVRDGTGAKHSVAPGTLSLGAGLRMQVDGNAAAQARTAPLAFTAGKGGPLTLKRPYRGQIQVDVVDGRLRAIDIVGLEQYLYGVVPSQMPSPCASQALQDQSAA